jgi:hypothetical protein
LARHRKQLDGFLNQYWGFYHQLLAYKDSPSLQQAAVLTEQFNTLFTTKTGYDQLDERIAKTLIKSYYSAPNN